MANERVEVTKKVRYIVVMEKGKERGFSGLFCKAFQYWQGVEEVVK